MSFHVNYYIFMFFLLLLSRFSHWFNNELIHDNKLVSSQWMITKGTLGLGCHTGAIGCHTSYDNIKVTKYISVFPTVSLGKYSPYCVWFGHMLKLLKIIHGKTYLCPVA